MSTVLTLLPGVTLWAAICSRCKGMRVEASSPVLQKSWQFLCPWRKITWAAYFRSCRGAVCWRTTSLCSQGMPACACAASPYPCWAANCSRHASLYLPSAAICSCGFSLLSEDIKLHHIGFKLLLHGRMHLGLEVCSEQGKAAEGINLQVWRWGWVGTL